MNWETIISIISLAISVFTILFFSVYPYIKKAMINKTFQRIECFYDIYSILNPCFFYKEGCTKDITHQLIQQCLIAYGFPKFKYIIKNNLWDFDLFYFNLQIDVKN